MEEFIDPDKIGSALPCSQRDEDIADSFFDFEEEKVKGNSRVNQDCEFFNIFDQEQIDEISKNVIGQKIVHVFGIQSVKDGIRVAMTLSNNKRFVISQVEWRGATFLKSMILEKKAIEQQELKQITAPLAHPVRATDS